VLAYLLLMVLLYPWPEHGGPEHNWLRGPLWLLKVRSTGDKLIGLVAAAFLMPLIMCVAIFPRAWALIISGLGVVLWIACGVYLAMLAVV